MHELFIRQSVVFSEFPLISYEVAKTIWDIFMFNFVQKCSF